MLEASQIPNFLVGFALAFAQIRGALPGSALAGLPEVVALDVPLLSEIIGDARGVRFSQPTSAIAAISRTILMGGPAFSSGTKAWWDDNASEQALPT